MANCPTCERPGELSFEAPWGAQVCAQCDELVRRMLPLLPTPDPASPSNDLGADSLEVVEMVMEMEEALGLDIPSGEISEIHSFEDAVRTLQRHRPPA